MKPPSTDWVDDVIVNGRLLPRERSRPHSGSVIVAMLDELMAAVARLSKNRREDGREGRALQDADPRSA